ncbi:HPr family phosphocarrier protein [Halalkalibacter alkalisediminis]|uniref:HPr family phosphocarrier protein n=1 Tax=Halalkalibacter alkalisediminis TaxID=935616 RepID=A0ABV6NIR2_9BACI|nr:HPr family phosphocarrier protein [Halalkalibacter alkalisediminis]
MRVKVLQPIFGEAASRLVNKASEYPETILIRKAHWVVDAKSLLGLLAISLQPEQEIEFEVRGSKSQEGVESIVNLGLFEKV